LADDEEDEAAFRTTFGQLKDQTSKSLKVTSTIQRNAYGNMQELLVYLKRNYNPLIIQ